MALKPTIYKCKLDLSDLDRHVYESLELTIAQHPSETVERMMARLLAYCLNAQEYLTFTKGLSTPDEPDIWCRSLDDQLQLWIDVGEPNPERIKKATRTSRSVKVYSFNSKSDVWWSQEKEPFGTLSAEVWQFPWDKIQQLAKLVQRTMAWSITVSEGTVFVSTEQGDCEIPCQRLTEA